MSSARDLIRTLGAADIANAVKVDVKVVHNKSRRFPASWWLAVSKLAADRGAECPPDAFSFRENA